MSGRGIPSGRPPHGLGTLVEEATTAVAESGLDDNNSSKNNNATKNNRKQAVGESETHLQLREGVHEATGHADDHELPHLHGNVLGEQQIPQEGRWDLWGFIHHTQTDYGLG